MLLFLIYEVTICSSGKISTIFEICFLLLKIFPLLFKIIIKPFPCPFLPSKPFYLHPLLFFKFMETIFCLIFYLIFKFETEIFTLFRKKYKGSDKICKTLRNIITRNIYKSHNIQPIHVLLFIHKLNSAVAIICF